MEPRAARILVVDDEQGIRSLVEAILTNEGYTVRLAADARQAIASCESESYDLLLSDVQMPEMDGHVLAQWIAARRPQTRTALMTAFDAECRGCPYAPRCAILSKPFRPVELATFVRSVLSCPPQLTSSACV
jgi:two-component system cell cycle response regulator CpdR